MRRSNASTNPYRTDPKGGKGGGFYRDRQTIKRLQMYRSKPDIKKMKQQNTDPQAGKVQPDRKWFGNTRVLD